MKKVYTTALLIFMGSSLNAQSLNDDFESYSVGDYLGDSSPNWTTWSGTTGGAEDVQITDANAHNGTKSIYFSSNSANGGPVDVLLPFGGEHTSGQFSFDSWFFVENGKNGYFNIQGSATAGQIYSMNCNMTEAGELRIDDGSTVVINASYPVGTWFNFKMVVNLNINEWEIFVDNVSVGVFQNVENLIASMDLYPISNSSYFVDEVMFNVVPYVLPNKNGAVIAINETSGLASQEIMPSATIRNLGVQDITSFDLTIDYDGNQIIETITGVSILSYDTYDVDFSQILTLASGTNTISATISNINGVLGDDDPSDDTKNLVLNPIVPAPGKMVLAEEGTGTWCGWCPRGAVMLDKMEDQYHDFFAGIAVHNGDPMVVPLYDDGLNFSSFPTSKTDRGQNLNPTQIENEFYNRIIIPPSAFITNGAYYNEGAGKLYVSVSSDFQTNISGDYRIACALTEDSVTGTGSGYNQSNYYSGGQNGVMGGYELLPNPVPASLMVYDHVARAILPNVNGQANSFPTSVSSGEIHTVSFVFNIDSTWDMSKMHIIGFLIDDDGIIDNAGKATIEEAIANGYLSLEENQIVDQMVKPIYPNPAQQEAYFDINVESAEQVTLIITDMQGRLIVQKDYGVLNGAFKLPIQTELLPNGIYMVNITVGTDRQTQRLIVE